MFCKEGDLAPCKMWVAHEDKYVWSDDFKKACFNLEVTKEELQAVVDSF